LYPANFPMELIPLIRENPRICRYIDIPIQHISDRMLALMKRSHNRKETEEVLRKLRTEIPGAVIRTTLIAGHPGETEEDYSELKDFISDFRFDRLGVFAYSHEEDTYSFSEYKDDVPDSVKESRVSELMEIQQNISAEINESLVGKVLKVIIDRKEGQFFVGRTEFDSPEVDQEVLISIEHNLKPGNFYNIRITGSNDFDLFGIPDDWTDY
jgi:ribosomal protein S12 methylthiotransferase